MCRFIWIIRAFDYENVSAPNKAIRTISYLMIAVQSTSGNDYKKFTLVSSDN